MFYRLNITIALLAQLTMALLAAVLFTAPLVAAPPFRFTALPDEDETRLRQRFGKVAAYLEQSLGVQVKYIPVKSYAAAVTAFANNQVQMAWFGGLSGVRARKIVAGSQAIAQGHEDQFFVTYFIAHASTGLRESEWFPTAIKGLTFTFGSKGSTSGRLMPEFYIRKELGDAPQRIFRRVGFSGNHSKTIALVQSGAYQAGAVNYKVWENETKAGRIDPSKVRIIWRTPTYPDYNWSVRGDVDRVYGAGFTNRVKEALLAMKERSLLDAFPRRNFIPASNADYVVIENTAKSIGLIE